MYHLIIILVVTCTYIQVFLWTPKIFSEGEILTLYKKYHFGDVLNRKPAFLKPQWWNLAWGCRPGTPFPTPNFVKIT